MQIEKRPTENTLLKYSELKPGDVFVPAKWITGYNNSDRQALFMKVERPGTALCREEQQFCVILDKNRVGELFTFTSDVTVLRYANPIITV
jgi:hypothetical protein